MQTIDVPVGDGVLRTRVVGHGPVLLFVHGALVDGSLWDAVIPRLSDRFTCVIPDLPMGSHALPLPPEADRSPAGQARRLARLVEALNLEQVTLVGNDTGGAICQLVAVDHRERIAGLVLTNCDAFEVFPPPAYVYLTWLARRPWAMGLLTRLMNALPVLARLPTAYGGLSSRRLDGELLRRWLRPGLDRAVRDDIAGLFRGIEPHVTLEAARKLRSFDRPALLAWGRNDPHFTWELAERLQRELPQAQLIGLDSATYVPLDQPEQLASLIVQHMAPIRATMSA